MKIKIDKIKCTGCGTCVALCPKIFTLNNDGKAAVIDKSGCDKNICNCQDVIESCPAQAISVD